MDKGARLECRDGVRAARLLNPSKDSARVTEHRFGTTALVTGGTGGIGKANALGLAQAGGDVLIAGRDNDKGRCAERASTT
jgi:NADPH:quinone reductase-like Zn-dependent oxidoreductase